MNALAAVQRVLALGAVALLAGVAALAVSSIRADAAEPETELRAIPAPGGGWYRALAAGRRGARVGRRTACGHILRRDTVGVAHPVLPCDAKIYIRFGGRNVLTQVIDRGPYVPGREFELTRRLAELVALRGTQPIEWRFAG